MYLYLCMIYLCVCVTGCMIFVVCCTCALIAVPCLAKETKLKMWLMRGGGVRWATKSEVLNMSM